MARTKSQQLGTARREARRQSGAIGAPVGIVTHPKRGFLRTPLSPAVERAKQRHYRRHHKLK